MTEYIPRLREELVAAAAREQAGLRHRPRVRPRAPALAAAAAVLVVALVLAVRAVEAPRDEQPVTPAPAGSLRYHVDTVPGDDAEAAVAKSADVLRVRIAALGIQGATVTVTSDELDVLGGGAQVPAIAAPGRLAIFDWEASVLGPDGRPAPDDRAHTGGDAGRVGAVSRYEAVQRASKAGSGGGVSTFWVVDDATRSVLAGPEFERPAGVAPGARVVEVPGRAHVVRGGGGWFALGPGAMGNAHVASASGGRDPMTGEPMVAIGLNEQGRSAFSLLTRDVARRGARLARPGESPLQGSQHLAIVLDDRILSMPYVNYQEAPNGIDGRDGVQIEGGLTPERARQIAAMLESGPMPALVTPSP